MLPLHKLCELLPDIKGKQFDEMVEDICDRGQVDPIDVFCGEVIDGKNRQRACAAAGVAPQYVEWTPPPECESEQEVQLAIADFVYSRNFLRRHQSDTDRAMFAAALRKNAQTSLSEVSRQLNVSERLVGHATKVLRDGDESLVQAVRDGQVAVSDASRVSSLPKSKQSEAVEAVKEGKARTVSAAAMPRKEIPPPVFDTEEAVEEMSNTLTLEEIFGEQESSLPSQADEDVVGPGLASQNVVDGCFFTASAQASWRSSFSLLTRMAGEWLKQPNQQAVKMKSERSHGEFLRILGELEGKWREMNGNQGRWS